MKKIVLAAALCSSFAMANIEDYKRGFEAAIESMRTQLENNNLKPENIYFKNENVLYIDITSLDSTSVLLIQHLANTNSFNEVYISKDKLFLGSYERDADAIKYKAKAESILGERVHISKKDILVNAFTNPLFFKDFYSSLVNPKDNTILIREPVYIKEPVKEPVKKVSNQNSKSSVPKKFTLKNGKAQGYTLSENETTSQARNFTEIEIFMTDTKYDLGQTVKTGDGKTFLKVKNKNLYFLQEDVRF